MADVITALSTAITGEVLWKEVLLIVPLIGVLIIFAFGYRQVRKLVNGAQRGKAKM